MRSSPSATARVRLPATLSVGMSRRLLATRIAQARAPTPTPAYSAASSKRLGLDVRRAEHRDQAEEDEDHHLAEAHVAVGPRAAGVEPGGEDAQQPDRRPATRPWSPRAPARRAAAPPSARNAARLTARGRRDLAADQAQRADPVVVGAADAVGVVVGVVDADLQQQRDRQREQRLPPDRLPLPHRDRRCRRGPGRRRRAGCAGARLRSTGRGWPWPGLCQGYDCRS